MRDGQLTGRPSPLAEVAARISALADYLNSQVGIPDDPGWHRLTELLERWRWEVSDRAGGRSMITTTRRDVPVARLAFVRVTFPGKMSISNPRRATGTSLRGSAVQSVVGMGRRWL